MRVEFRDLHTLVDVLGDELLASPTYDVQSFLSGKTLVVRPKNEMGRPWGRNVRKIKTTLLEHVAMYNLTGEWPSDYPREPALLELNKKWT